MAFPFKTFSLIALFALIVSACNKDDNSAFNNYQLNTRDVDFRFDTLIPNTVFSDFVNLNGLKMDYVETEWTLNTNQQYPVKVHFVGHTDTSNKLTIQLSGFLPTSETGIMLRVQLFGWLNSIQGQTKCTLNGYGDFGTYRTLPNGNCQVFIPSSQVSYSTVLPGNPKFFASMLLEFPKPQEPVAAE